MDRQDLINFYNDTNYRGTSLSIRGIPPRPSEWNVPLFIKKIYPENIDLLKNSLTNKSIEIQLDQEDINYFKALMLHESLFNFYKGYYNYLCALKLYDGGLQHWIDITAYYSKLYMANSIIALTGNSRYVVNGSNKNFVEDIYKLVNPKGYNRNIEINGKFVEEHAKYGIEINIDPSSNLGVLNIITNLGSGGSHGYIWNKYSEIDTTEFNITRMTYDYPQHLSNERNLENYSFDGYKQLDFNLGMENFKDYFERDYIKDQAHLIYTSETAIILGVIGELYNLYESLGVKNLPIEKEKLIFMCEYSLGNTKQSIKLVDLIKSGFPKENKYIDEYYWYESY
ncbi:hypothetical protein [Neobacillus mesonae]|uniref:Uncharacterized protein n=1 Tax=Neobacillus mesonae TaxID=1193713 RepID=A0A3Q9QTH8_9BACI|nr:hypothetical protein [Neobacillus mesonae]AZU60263.1 hypothetical protein CHR53_02700 [Neobacillus mesonae]